MAGMGAAGILRGVITIEFGGLLQLADVGGGIMAGDDAHQQAEPSEQGRQRTGPEGAGFAEQLGPPAGQRLARIGKHPLARHPIELEAAAGRQKGKARLDLLAQQVANAAEQGAVAEVEAEATAGPADAG